MHVVARNYHEFPARVVHISDDALYVHDIAQLVPIWAVHPRSFLEEIDQSECIAGWRGKLSVVFIGANVKGSDDLERLVFLHSDEARNVLDILGVILERQV